MHVGALLARGGKVDNALSNSHWSWRDAAALFAGLSTAEAKAFLAGLTQRGLRRDHILLP